MLTIRVELAPTRQGLLVALLVRTERKRATPEFPLGRRQSSAHRFPLIPRRGIARSYSHHQSDCCCCRTRGPPVYQQEFAGPGPHARAVPATSSATRSVPVQWPRSHHHPQSPPTDATLGARANPVRTPRLAALVGFGQCDADGRRRFREPAERDARD
jgi:hypothetical protein